MVTVRTAICTDPPLYNAGTYRNKCPKPVQLLSEPPTLLFLQLHVPDANYNENGYYQYTALHCAALHSAFGLVMSRRSCTRL